MNRICRPITADTANADCTQPSLRLPRRTLLGVATAVAIGMLATAAAPAAAQGYPNKPIRLVLGFAAGGPTDVIARTLAQRLSTQLGVSVVVDNRPGADSLIASQQVMHADRDGHTLYLASSAHAINPYLFKNPGFDAVKDFTSISLVGEVPNLVIVNAGLPVKNLAEFIDYAKARQGKLNYATTASVTYLATELLNRAAGIELQRVAYKGAAPATTAVIGGEVQMMVSGIGPLLPFVKSGKVRPLAITGAQRSPLAPDVPTAIEAGVPGHTSSVWYALLGPAGLPAEVVARLNEETRKALADAETRNTLLAQGVEPRASSPGELAAFMGTEATKWQKVIVDVGAQPN